MTVFILVLAVMFEGETHIFQYGNGREAVQFKSPEACELELKRQRDMEIPKLLAKSPGAKLEAIRCIPKQVDGV